MSAGSTFVTLVLDGVGIGAQADADQYGDAGADTLAHTCARARPRLPNLTRLGLGCIAPLEGVPAVENPTADFGRMRETSAGKDSTTGHWELAGIHLDRPFPTYPQGFPRDVIASFIHKTRVEGVLGNRPASGTEIIVELGVEHERTGRPIVYTSADSVFQVAAHIETISLEALYRMCRIAREDVCVGEHAVGRVIARPFRGEPGAYVRISEKRKDFALAPPAPPLQQTLQHHGIATCAIGKIADLFARVGFDEVVKTRSNAEGIEQTRVALERWGQQDQPAFIWTNLVDFDQEYGHRNDVSGFAAALEAFDRALPSLIDALPSDGRLLITADHGNDPTFPGTDHTREHVPLLVYSASTGIGQNLGLRPTFADHAMLVATYFGVPFHERRTMNHV